MRAQPLFKRDVVVTLLALALLLAWDFAGYDLSVTRLFGNAQGFAWRDSFIFSTLLHEGGRAGAWVVMAALVFATWRWGNQGPSRAERLRWVGVMLLCVVAVPALKRFSATSCPWDLAEFGGVARYVSHWQFGVADGGGGHCFPSGHAVAAFAFIGQYFLWRGYDAGRARAWLVAVLVAGLVVGSAQLVRGAHYPSHTLWTAWLCWAICVLAATVFQSREKEIKP